jgi:hypothetical protein
LDNHISPLSKLRYAILWKKMFECSKLVVKRLQRCEVFWKLRLCDLITGGCMILSQNFSQIGGLVYLMLTVPVCFLWVHVQWTFNQTEVNLPLIHTSKWTSWPCKPQVIYLLQESAPILLDLVTFDLDSTLSIKINIRSVFKFIYQ